MGLRLSEPTSYSEGQPQLAMELSAGKPAPISGTIQHTKMTDHLERVQCKHYVNVSLVCLKWFPSLQAEFRYSQNISDI